MEPLGREPEAWGPWCSLAWFVLRLLLIQMTLQKPASSFLGVAGTLVYGNDTLHL